MKRGAPATEADVDALLEGFGASQEVKQQCSAALARLQKDDPGGLALALALRITGADPEVRRYAAVLLTEVFRSSPVVPSAGGSVERGAQWLREEIGPALLEALAAAGSPMVRSATAEAVAMAAFSQFKSGRAWPELTSQLARMCTGGPAEMSTVLEFLEVLHDEAESPNLECGNAMMWVYAQLAALEEDSGALHKLLSCALMDTQESMVDAAARIYCFCAAGAEVPEEVQVSVRDLAPQLAQAVVREPREAALQAVALSASADPSAWLQPKDNHLPAILAKCAMDSTCQLAARQAALKAMLQLMLALETSTTVDHLCDEEVSELRTHLVASIGSILAEMPTDEATDHWAEVVDGEEQAAPDDESEILLEDCLDHASYLTQNDEGRCALRVAAEQLLQTEVWQAKHGGLLLMLRVALEGEVIDEDAVQAVSGVALSCFSQPHPRVRWAALEVWARLLQHQITTPLELFDQAIEALLKTTGDAYARVRQRGLLVLVQLSRVNAQMVAKYPDALSRFLLRLSQSGDPEAQQAGAEIAEHLKLPSGALEGAFSFPPEVAEDSQVIEWPLDWKQH